MSTFSADNELVCVHVCIFSLTNWNHTVKKGGKTKEIQADKTQSSEDPNNVV